MEEESSDMDNVNDRYTLCTEEAEEQPTSAADDLHLEDRNVNVMENADAYQETEVVLDSDYDDLAFDCTGCSTPEGSKTDRDCDQFGITMSPGLWLDQYHNLAPKEGNDEYDGKNYDGLVMYIEWRITDSQNKFYLGKLHLQSARNTNRNLDGGIVFLKIYPCLAYPATGAPLQY
eukprot:Em0006g1304a